MTIPRIDSLDRNLFINGGFDYSQRIGTGLKVVDTSPAYGFDRWLDFHNVGFNVNPSVARVSGDTPSNKVKFVADFTLTEVANSGATVTLQQRIESIFSRNAVSKPISLSIFQKTDSWQKARLILSVADVEDDFSAVTEFHNQLINIKNDSTWEELLFENITVPSNGGNGIDVKIVFEDPSIIASVMSFKVAAAKLSLGTKAQNFSYAGRDAVEELQLCQRYYEKLVHVSGRSIQLQGRMNGGGNATNYGHFRTIKRITPVVILGGSPTIYGADWGAEYGSIATGGTMASFFANAGTRYGINISGTSGTNGHAVSLFSLSTNASIGFDAEL